MSTKEKETEELAAVAPHVSEQLQAYISPREVAASKPFNEAKYAEYFSDTD